MKRTLFVLISILMAGSMLLTACGSKPVAKPSITFWHSYHTGESEETAMTAILAQAAIDMPDITINVLQVPFNDIYNKYRTDVAAGGGPDMFVAPNDSLGDDARAGLIADITALVSGKLNDYAPLSIDGMTVDGKIYGVPESLKAVVFWYNKSMLPTPPATTAELQALMEGGKPVGITFGCYHLWGFYNDFGGKIFDGNWKIIADQGTGVTDAMTYLNDLYQIAKTNGWPLNDTDSLAPFKEGTIAAVTNGNWQMADYKSSLGDNLGMAPLPAGPSGVAQPFLGVDGYYINPNSANKEAAIRVALYLSGAAAEKIMMEQAGHVPAITTAAVTDPLLKGLQEAFKNGYVRPQVPQLGLYWSNFCGMDQVFEKGIAPATWVAEGTANANK